MARPTHDESEGGFAMFNRNAKAEEIMANVNAQIVSRKEHAKLAGTTPDEAYIDENKIPPYARDADESIEED